MSELIGLNQKFETIVNSLAARLEIESTPSYFHVHFNTHHNGYATFAVTVELEQFPLPTVQSRLDYIEQLLKAFLNVDNVKLMMDAIEWRDVE